VVDDGLDALDFVAAGEAVDCILMDWQMPGLDGVETTRRIRSAEDPDAHVPILGMTASAQPSDRRTCLEAGMDDLLVKPVGLRDLGSALARWIGPEPAPAEERPCGPAADVAALDRLAEDLGSVGPVRSIVGTYLTELGRRRELIQGAVTDGDADLLQRTAHTLRSTSRTLGAVELDEISSLLEHGAFPPPDSLLGDFERSADGTRRALQDWLDTHPATPG
jgi:CheY-like chemotaxis protein/HPt (histidine-containing phosphotransfer) domain-containing protein